MLQYSYPRLDAEVSKHRNHLLKSPFVVHPGTSLSESALRETSHFEGAPLTAALFAFSDRVCVPIDPAKVGSFDPAKVPTVGLLLRELGEAQKKAEEAVAAASMEVDPEDATPRKKGDVRICGQSHPTSHCDWSRPGPRADASDVRSSCWMLQTGGTRPCVRTWR